MKTEELIAKLSGEQSKKNLRTPKYYASYFLLILIFYLILAQYHLGFRNDLSAQLLKKSFLLEIFLLIFLSLTGAIASILLIYPDYYQKKNLIKISNFLLAITTIIVATQMILSAESSTFITTNSHNIECSICIAAIAAIPSLLIFGLIKKGATTKLKKAGFFAILTCASLGCLALRLSENNDVVAHFAIWHYFPTLLFACLGALFGKYFLKW